MFNHAVRTECVLSYGHNSAIRSAVWTIRIYTRSGHQVFDVGGSGES